jgi:hypothetical protein
MWRERRNSSRGRFLARSGSRASFERRRVLLLAVLQDDDERIGKKSRS